MLVSGILWLLFSMCYYERGTEKRERRSRDKKDSYRVSVSKGSIYKSLCLGGIVLNLITVNREKTHKSAFVQTSEGEGEKDCCISRQSGGLSEVNPKCQMALKGEKSHHSCTLVGCYDPKS